MPFDAGFGTRRELIGMWDRRERKLQALNAVTTAIGQSLDVDQVIQAAIEQVMAVTAADVCAVYLREPRSGDLRLVAAEGVSDDFVEDPHIAEVPAGTSWWHKILTQRSPIIWENTSAHDRPSRDAVIREGLQSTAYVPLKARGRINGAIAIASRRQREFSEADVDVLSAIGEQIGIAVENAWLFSRQEEQLTKLHTLHEIARTISGSLDLTEALDRILVELQRVIAFDSAAVWLVEGGRLRALAARQYADVASDAEVTLSVDDPLFQEVARTRQPLVLRDAQADSRFKGVGETEYVRGWVCAPLLVRDGVIGCLTVDSRYVGAYDERDADTIMTFARHAAVALENAQLHEQTQQQVKALEALHDIAIDLLGRRETEDLLRSIVRRASDLVGATGGGIYLYDPEADELTITVSVGIAEDYVGRTLKPGQGLAGRVVETGEPIWIEDYESWESRPAQYEDAPFRASISVPLQFEGEMLGALSLSQDEPGQTFDEADAKLLNLLAAQAAVALENARLYQELSRLATHDGLTGLYNHRHFHELLQQEVARADRYEHAVSLVLIDLDGFKEYNDQHGHVAGDDALRDLAGILEEISRKSDIVARYGGEEFALILPETSAQEAMQVAERVRSNVEAQTRHSPFLTPLTASIGVASFPQDAGDASELLVVADKAMYSAKGKGKNRIAAFETIAGE